MSAAQTTLQQGTYSLGHTPQEYERLRMQARLWEPAAGRLLDELGLGPGASCLDAGCGPGETMSAMARRVGPAGRVLGIDSDAALGALALEMLHGAGHRQCAFRAHDIGSAEPVPGAPFDLVYARLLLFHLPRRAEVIARLWDAVAPGGCLLIQDYDLRGVTVLPELPSFAEVNRVINGAFTAAGADPHTGARLAALFAEAGLGAPDGTDVAGHIEPLSTARFYAAGTFRSLLPLALAHGITTPDAAAETLAALEDDAARRPDSPMVYPLLMAAWKRKERA